ncbi:MAG: T9SS type A sorting domain-containing protein, partial [Bacteroidia bacterium]
PNPSNGSFQIQFSAPVSGAQVELVSMMGQRLELFTVNGTNYTYDRAQKLAAGVYLLRITVNGKEEVKRIVVE